METKEMICINCPLGCNLTVTRDGEKITVVGNTCPRGERYAVSELTHPTRTLTTTMSVSNRDGVYVSVKTKEPISKAKIFEAMKKVNSVSAEAPIRAGDVLIKDIVGETDIIATSDVE